MEALDKILGWFRGRQEPLNYEASGMLPESFKYEDTTPFATERANKSGMYSTDFARELTRAALNQGVNPVRALGTYMKETNLGTRGDFLNPGQSHKVHAPKVNARLDMRGIANLPEKERNAMTREELIFDTIRQMREADASYGKDTDRSIKAYNSRAKTDVPYTKGYMSDLLRNEAIKRVLQDEQEAAPYRWEYPE